MPFIQLQFRRGLAAQWTSADPTLASGEMGIETDTSLFKIGNGSTVWSLLPYGGFHGATGETGDAGGATGATGQAGDKFQTATPSVTIIPTQGGTLSLTVTSGLAYIAGNSVVVVDSGSALNRFEATVTSYSGTQLDIENITNITGDFTGPAIYNVNLDGVDGPAGVNGLTGATGEAGGATGATGEAGMTGAGTFTLFQTVGSTAEAVLFPSVNAVTFTSHDIVLVPQAISSENFPTAQAGIYFACSLPDIPDSDFTNGVTYFDVGIEKYLGVIQGGNLIQMSSDVLGNIGSPHSYVAGDTFEIYVDGRNVFYYINGGLVETTYFSPYYTLSLTAELRTALPVGITGVTFQNLNVYVTGLAGTAGATGATGSGSGGAGLTGSAGATGATGTAGGVTGETGSQGATGAGLFTFFQTAGSTAEAVLFPSVNAVTFTTHDTVLVPQAISSENFPTAQSGIYFACSLPDLSDPLFDTNTIYFNAGIEKYLGYFKGGNFIQMSSDALGDIGSLHAYQAGDTFEIYMDGNNVYYYINGALLEQTYFSPYYTLSLTAEAYNPLPVGITGVTIENLNVYVTGRSLSGSTGETGIGIDGTYYSDYLYWDPTLNGWQVGSSQVHLGFNAASSNQGQNSVAIGYNSGYDTQGDNAVAIGTNAGYLGQNRNAIAIGNSAGSNTQSSNAVAIGVDAGVTLQGLNTVGIGQSAAFFSQLDNAVAVGNSSGYSNQGAGAVAVGLEAGRNDQQTNAVAIGNSAANTTQGSNSIAIGTDAARDNQNSNSIAIGNSAAFLNQGESSIALGQSAGQNTQGNYAVSIGFSSGSINQGENSIAIGKNAGYINQSSNSIILNASGSTLDSLNAGFFVNPVNSSNEGYFMKYIPTTSEIIYDSAASSLGVTGETGPVGITGATGPIDPTAWQTYSVAWTASSGTAPDIGNGTLDGRYKTIGKTAFVNIQMNAGSSTTFGNAGNWLFSLPVNAYSPGSIMLTASMLDNGIAWYEGMATGTYAGLTDKFAVMTQTPGITGATCSALNFITPFTWGNIDSLQIGGSYETE